MNRSHPHHAGVLRRVALTSIDSANRTFALSPFCEPPPALERSIREVGVLTPPRVQSVARGRFRLVAGFRRVEAARAAGIEAVDCLSFPPGDDLGLFLEAVHENLGTRELSDLERATILLKLREQFDQPRQELVDRYLPLLGLKAENRVMQRLLKVARLPEVLKRALRNWRTELVLRAAGWAESEQQLLESLGRRYRIGHNRQKELISLLMELKAARRAAGRKADLETLWEDCGASEADREASLPEPRRLEKIIDRLRAARYPILVGQLAKAAELKQSLGLPERIRFDLPRHFEGSRIQLQAAFASPSELRRLADELLRVSRRKELGELFELL